MISVSHGPVEFLMDKAAMGS